MTTTSDNQWKQQSLLERTDKRQKTEHIHEDDEVDDAECGEFVDGVSERNHVHGHEDRAAEEGRHLPVMDGKEK